MRSISTFLKSSDFPMGNDDGSRQPTLGFCISRAYENPLGFPLKTAENETLLSGEGLCLGGGRLTNAMTSKCNIHFSFITGQKKATKIPIYTTSDSWKWTPGKQVAMVTRDSNLVWYTLLSIICNLVWPPVHLTWEKLRRCWVHCPVGVPLLAIPLRHRSLQLAQHWFEQTWIYPDAHGGK